MRIYVRKEFGTEGPYSLKQLQDLVDDGAVTFNDSAWIEGTADWVPLNKIEGLFVPAPPEPGAAPVVEGPQVRPWVRYWARSIDYLLMGIVVSFPFAFILPVESQNRFVDYLIFCFGMALWVPIEAIFLATIGSTPGKALLRISVMNNDGSKLSLGQALSRSLNVWWKGLGTGLIPLVTLITNAVSYRHLSDKGMTEWDRRGHFRVTHREVGVVNAVTTVAILSFAVVVVAFGLRF